MLCENYRIQTEEHLVSYNSENTDINIKHKDDIVKNESI
jgi:hypothetical protein